MEKTASKIFNINLFLGIVLGSLLTYAIISIFFGIEDSLKFSDSGNCSSDNEIYLDWSLNYNPSNNYAIKVSDEEYRSGKAIYDNSIQPPILDGAYGGTIDVKFLSSYLCQAKLENATSISFNISQPENQAAKVHLFSNAVHGLTTQVITFTKVSGCPPNCRGGDTMSQ